MSDTNAGATQALADPAEVTNTTAARELDTDATKQDAGAIETTEKNTDGVMNDVTPLHKTATVDNTNEAAIKDESSAGKLEDKSEDKQATNGADEKNSYRNGDRNGRNYNDRNNQYQKTYKKSNHEEFENLPESDDPQEILDQVEFYFSIQNLSTDWHMFDQVRGARNHPISIKHITTFKRMKRFQPYSAVVAALRKSENLDVVDKGDFSGIGNEGVKRKEAISVPVYESDEERRPYLRDLHNRLKDRSHNSLNSSIYVKGFGDEAKAGQITIEKFFKPYGSVMVRKRRDNDDKWKGSVFVEFGDEEAQKQFLALEPKPTFNGNELTVLSKKDYSENKCAEKGIIPAWKREPGAGEGTRGHHGPNRGYNRGGRGRGRGRGHNYNKGSGHRRSRSRSPDYSRDWNGRRDKFQKSKEYKNDRRSRDFGRPYDSKNKSTIQRDADGVPIVRDTRGEPDPWLKTNKRKAEGADRDDSPKKSKIERDADGVPIVRDTRGEPDPSPKTNKRKAEGADRDDSPKKSKVEIKEDA